MSIIDDVIEAVPEIMFTILGEPCSKANSRRLVNFGKRPALIKSKKALAYERDARRQIPGRCKVMFETPVAVRMTLYYASERPDLDASIVLDVMQPLYAKVGGKRIMTERGVYENDRLVRELHLYHAIDKANPRAEIEVRVLA